MKKFKIVGIELPGTIYNPLVGKVNLADVDDNTAQKLFDNGCPFLEKVVPATKPSEEMQETPKPKK